MRLPRLLTLAAALALTSSSDALAGQSCRCGGGGSGRQGGPIRNAIQAAREARQERREARTGCEPAAGFPATTATAGVPAVVTGAGCESGRCPLVR